MPESTVGRYLFNMRLLLIGGSGQVGSEILSLTKENNIECISPSSSELNITEQNSINEIIESNLPIDFIINASAYTAVDKAEDEIELAFKINRDGPQYLAEACTQHGIPLLHISTDYVFDGTASIPYTEEMTIHPLGVYGASKAEGEQAVRDCLAEHIILRTAWVYGVHGNNFVKTMLRLGRERSELKVVSDQIGCPTAAEDIAEAIINVVGQMVEKPNNRWGTYHYCSADSTNWAEFANGIFTGAVSSMPDYPSVHVTPISTTEYPTKAARPIYSVLDCSKIEQFFTIKPPSWLLSLQRYIPNILKNM